MDYDFIQDCKTLNDVCVKLFNKASYYNRKKVKKILIENNIDWDKRRQEIEENRKKEKIGTCKYCGKTFIKKNSNQIFCSHSCSATYNNVLNGEKALDTRQKISDSLRKYYSKPKQEIEDRYCLNCGKRLKGGRKTYCSNKC